jgi:NADPH-dependent curcumin reductase CurA
LADKVTPGLRSDAGLTYFGKPRSGKTLLIIAVSGVATALAGALGNAYVSGNALL